MAMHQAHYRGYCIEGQRGAEAWRLHVSPMKSDLPILKYPYVTASPAATWAEAVAQAVRDINAVLYEQ